MDLVCKNSDGQGLLGGTSSRSWSWLNFSVEHARAAVAAILVLCGSLPANESF